MLFRPPTAEDRDILSEYVAENRKFGEKGIQASMGLASAKTILKNGGIFTEESNRYSPERVSLYFRIPL